MSYCQRCVDENPEICINKLINFIDKHGWTIALVGLLVGTIAICFAI